MYVDIVPNRSSPPAILLRESWREGSKIRKKTIANISHWPRFQVEALRGVLKGEHLVPVDQLFLLEGSLPHGHVEAILGTLRKLGLERILGRRQCEERTLVVAMIVEQVLHSCSKLAQTRLWETTSLGEELGVLEADENDLYRALDWLLERQGKIEGRLAKRHLGEGAFVFYDVTSSYYEGRTCPLARLGYGRDGKKGLPVIVYGTLADGEGRPISVQVYPGNTADPLTVADQVRKLREDFGLKRVVLVGDRGMLTQTQIEVLRRYPGLGWITALRAPAIRELLAKGSLQRSLFDVQNLAEINSPDFPDERLIACYNPILAEERRRKRKELLEATEASLEKIQRQVERRTKTPLSEGEIGVKVGKVFSVPCGCFARLKGWISGFVRFAIAPRRTCVLTSFYVCWPIMWNGTCAKP
ncbi:IS1634 family transposase ISMasp1 [subsurface metagenome]